MKGYQELKREIFLKHGTGASDLASVIIHLEEENENLLKIIERLERKIKS